MPSMQPSSGRLATLERHLGASTVVLALSLDIIDTLLLRQWRCELERFADFAVRQHQALLAATGTSPGAAAIYRARLLVHQRAYQLARTGGVEVRHRDILGPLCERLNLSPALMDVLAEAEVAVEAEILTVNHGLVGVIERAAGERPVVLTSDMYLDGSALRRLLAALPSWLAAAPLLVSSEQGASKRRGDLFGRLVGYLGVPADTILHIGDHPVADVIQAKRAGLRTFHLPRPIWYRAILSLRDHWTKYWIVRSRDGRRVSRSAD